MAPETSVLLQTPPTLPILPRDPLAAPEENPLFLRALAHIDLSTATPVAHGNERHVYPHPTDASLLIKVINTERRSLSQKAHRIKRWYRRFHRESTYRVFITELSEYISTAARSPASGASLPLARVVGLVDTSMGLGLLVEKIVGSDGQMAPTLRHLIRDQGWNDCWEVQLNRFFSDLAERHVIFNDVGPQNIVFGRNAAGQEGLFLIDGFGSKQAIPVFAWSKRLNRRRLARKYATMLLRLKTQQQSPALQWTPCSISAPAATESYPARSTHV